MHAFVKAVVLRGLVKTVVVQDLLKTVVVQVLVKNVAVVTGAVVVVSVAVDVVMHSDVIGALGVGNRAALLGATGVALVVRERGFIVNDVVVEEGILDGVDGQVDVRKPASEHVGEFGEGV